MKKNKAEQILHTGHLNIRFGESLFSCHDSYGCCQMEKNQLELPSLPVSSASEVPAVEMNGSPAVPPVLPAHTKVLECRLTRWSRTPLELGSYGRLEMC